jgi:exoribonuclease R
MLKVIISDRSYSSWHFLTENDEPIDVDLALNPATSHIFSNDIIDITGNDISIISSPTREQSNIPGTLILDNKKTFTINGKIMYKCIPNDSALPIFLVPYKETLKFSKKSVNKYVTFRFDSWQSSHPEGRLEQTIGDVTDPNNYYEYRLYCKNLNISNRKFSQKVVQKLKSQPFLPHPNNEDRTNRNIITIDSESTQDYDDAIGCSEVNGDQCLSVYIANVPLFMEQNDLWSYFTKKVATIYLPDKKRSMLPTILTDNVLSLVNGELRNVFYVDIISNETGIIDVKFGNATICVTVNHVYESEMLNDDLEYKKIMSYTKSLSILYPYVKNIQTSFQLIEYLMILMNNQCAIKLKQHGKGIFRSLELTDQTVPDNVPMDIVNFAKCWKNTSSNYTIESKAHDLLELKDYIHITSPIRRLVDILNMIQMQTVCNIYSYGETATAFYETWLSQIDYINENSKKIRKVQNECEALHFCSVTDIDRMTFDGYVIEENSRGYNIYIPQAKMISSIRTPDTLHQYDKLKLKLYVFTDSETLKQKIRVDNVSSPINIII